mmetsp:Transcript_16744/g.25143  ORF Transcript_16744/g.25143 Transcript_16744/m.25143 type:complete len:425 (+) Transcript_16744:101-1375(+)|eukprot:CAMPEP_0185031986 /NCGR_PEP_ID=MMETSP1103-20130426/19799_1 /TAXON_ID=36769 /ORGANISM="Paraphysomonas bandaiensis, Strain Caron Lab Isolate" /LENGTH=424 /DNA_ID=CAMNT_0027567713 /DNA_START=16 /DNA_END=1290 /DNA_ORIENTATION=-
MVKSVPMGVLITITAALFLKQVTSISSLQSNVVNTTVLNDYLPSQSQYESHNITEYKNTSRSSHHTSGGFSKVVNSFNHNINWTKRDCFLALNETHKLPPLSCGVNPSSYILPRILITGSARSGTTMIAALISALFFPFSNDAHAHTNVGMVSWELAGPPQRRSSDFWGHRGKDGNSRLRFSYVFHQVRNPLASLRSLLTEYPHWQKNRRIIGSILPGLNFSDPPEKMALQVWVGWNSRLDKYRFIPVHRVEDFNVIDLLKSAGYDVSRTHPHIRDEDVMACYRALSGHNTRGNSANRFTWPYVMSIDKQLGQRAYEMALQYGYRYDKNSTLLGMKSTEATSRPQSHSSPKSRQLRTALLSKCTKKSSRSRRKSKPRSPKLHSKSERSGIQSNSRSKSPFLDPIDVSRLKPSKERKNKKKQNTS